jgi:hypothetical protein
MKQLIVITLFFIVLIFPAFGFCGEYFVFTHTFNNQQVAQEKASLVGGWVLNTSFYSKLTPNLYSVVRGPFKTKTEAQKTLSFLIEGGRYKGSYIKYAGKIDIHKGIKSLGISTDVLVALLGELRISNKQQKGADNPCEPQEAYLDIGINYYGLQRAWNSKTERLTFKPEKKHVDIGGFWVIKNSGEIDRMRICAE